MRLDRDVDQNGMGASSRDWRGDEGVELEHIHPTEALLGNSSCRPSQASRLPAKGKWVEVDHGHEEASPASRSGLACSPRR